MDYSKIRIVYFNSKEIKHNDILWGLLELDVQVSRPEIEVTYNHIDENEVQMIINEISACDAVFTQDFSVNVAEACHQSKVKYISWIYDSPQIALHTDYALYDENYIFSFDKKQIEMLTAFGAKHIFYQPLAANVAFQSTVKCSAAEAENYTCDISFVGQLYRKENLNSLFAMFSEVQKDLFIRYCNIYSCRWNDQLSIFDDTFDDYVSTLIPYVIQKDFEYYHLNPLYIVKCLFLSPFITHFERVRILSELSKQFDTVLYTTNSDYDYAKSFFTGRLNSKIPREESYKLFNCSKLNLNTTLRTIESGIPLRVFDIMGMGGAVITNWQPEVDELFTPDKDIIVYRSIDELIDKTSYYLKNDKARRSIASNGKRRIITEFSMVEAMKSILSQAI